MFRKKAVTLIYALAAVVKPSAAFPKLRKAWEFADYLGRSGAAQ